LRSAAGSCRRRLADPRGFTLIELLVALVIMALVVASVPRLLARTSPTLELQGTARLVRDGLLEARMAAIAQGRSATLELDLARRLMRVADGPEQALPERLAVALYTARDETLGDTVGSIRFFPDGSSTGGRIRLSVDGRQVDVMIDWLTGRVWLRDG
jgi:general secretion pathway protein H